MFFIDIELEELRFAFRSKVREVVPAVIARILCREVIFFYSKEEKVEESRILIGAMSCAISVGRNPGSTYIWHLDRNLAAGIVEKPLCLPLSVFVLRKSWWKPLEA